MPWRIFWEDRYHPTAIQADDHLHQCVVYIDLHMAPAEVIEPSRRWKHSGHHETQKPQSRYGIIDLLESNASLAFADAAQFSENPWERLATDHFSCFVEFPHPGSIRPINQRDFNMAW